jgi:TM2 domain-containing membrane protein YozV
MSKTKRKSPIIAGILSLLVPGLGVMYAGDVLKGFIYLVLTLGIFILRPIWGIILWLWNVADSYREAIRYNNRLDMQAGFEQKEALKKFQRENPFNSPDNPNPPSA